MTELLSEKMNLSVVILPAKVLADGTHKIRIAISHNSETRYYVTRFKVDAVTNLKKGNIVGVGNASYINQQLRLLMNNMYAAYDTIDSADCYTCSQLLEIIKDKMNKNKLVGFVDLAKEWLKVKESVCCKSSLSLYIEGIDKFADFAGENFVLASLTTRKVLDYANYMANELSLAPTTCNMRMRVLKYIYKYAVKHKLFVMELDPFEDYKPKKENIRDVDLTVTQLRQIRDVELSNENAIVCRDMFMLSFYLCGMNGADLCRLDFSNDSLSFFRQKTHSRRKDDAKTEFTIQPEARAIIDRYIHDGKLKFARQSSLTKFHNMMELHLKKVFDAAGVDRMIFYSARKTFTQLANLLGIRERVIEYCIGDKQSGDVISYYIQTNKRMADEAIRKVLDFVASNLTEDDLFNQTTKS